MNGRDRVSGVATVAATALTVIVTAAAVASTANAHSVFTCPPQRGILGGSLLAPGVEPVAGAPRDSKPH